MPQRFRWVTLWLCGILLAGLLFEMPNAQGARLVYAIWNFGHVVLFALLTYQVMYWRYSRLDRPAPGLRFGFWLVAGMALLGALIEAGQWLIGRDCEVVDIVADTCGALVALLLHRSWRSQWPGRWQRSACVMLGSALLVWSAREVMLHGADTVLRKWRFPELYSSASALATAARFELLRARVTRVQDLALSPAPLLKVELLPGEFSTVTLDQLNPDWTGHTALVWRWYNPGEALAFTCRAHDRQHERNGFDHRDRFNQSLTLEHGWNTLRFRLDSLRDAPAQRRMDVSQMRSIACFATHLPASRTLYLQNIELEP